MPTREQRLGVTYYADLATEAIEALIGKYPATSRPSVVVNLLTTLRTPILEAIVINRRIHKDFVHVVQEEIDLRRTMQVTNE